MTVAKAKNAGHQLIEVTVKRLQQSLTGTLSKHCPQHHWHADRQKSREKIHFLKSNSVQNTTKGERL